MYEIIDPIARIILYIVALCVMVGLFAYTLFGRKNIAVDILRDRNSFYRMVDLKTLENVYKFKIMNKGKSTQSYEITAQGFGKDLEVVIDDKFKNRKLASGEVLNLPVKIRAKMANIKRHIQNIKVQIKVKGESESIITEEPKYFGPKK